MHKKARKDKLLMTKTSFQQATKILDEGENIFPPLRAKFTENCANVLNDALIEQGILVPKEALLQLDNAYIRIGKKYQGISDPVI